MIEVSDLRKVYGQTHALRGVTFSIQRGEIVGLLGANGAGKTTSMKIIVGYLLPTLGTASVAGIDVIDNPLEVQEKIGYLPENAPLYHDMLVQEYLLFAGSMRGLTPKRRKARIAAVVDECGIARVLTRPIGQLSKGYRQRTGLAAAILHDPEILILDEPTNGLDPNQIIEIRGLIRRMGETKTIILSTHILSEVEATCGRAIILVDGSVAADGKLQDLTRSHVAVATLKVDDPHKAGRALAEIAGVVTVEDEPAGDGYHTFRLNLRDDLQVGEEVSRLARNEGWALRELRRDDKTLEQVFRELTVSGAEVAA